MPLIAAFTIEPPGKRVPLYINCQRCSIRDGSSPTSQRSKSWITAAVASSGPTEYASPIPSTPSSVSTFTKTRFRCPSWTR